MFMDVSYLEIMDLQLEGNFFRQLMTRFALVEAVCRQTRLKQDRKSVV